MSKNWWRPWLTGLAGVAVALLMLATPTWTFLNPRGRNRAVTALMTIGLALEARYVLQQALSDYEQVRRGPA